MRVEALTCLHDEHQLHPRTFQMHESTHDYSTHVEYQQRWLDNPGEENWQSKSIKFKMKRGSRETKSLLQNPNAKHRGNFLFIQNKTSTPHRKRRNTELVLVPVRKILLWEHEKT